MNNINIHLYPSKGEFETRVNKSMKAAYKSDRFENILFFTLGNKKIDSNELNIKNITESNSKILYLFYSILHLFKIKPSVINVHNWYCLIPAILTKIFFKSKIIYEPHEVEFGTSYARGLRKFLIIFVEFISIKFFINYIIFVGEAVKREYEKSYKPIDIIRDSLIFFSLPNYQPETKHSNFKKSAAYVGLFSKGRSIFRLIEVFIKRQDYDFYLIGHGNLKEKIQNKVKKYNNIHIKDPLNDKELSNFLNENIALGFSLMNPKSLSNRCAAPNKFFTFAHNEIPTVVSNSGDQAEIVKKFKIGYTIEEITNEEINKILDHFLKEKEPIDFKEFKKNYDYNLQEKKLIQIYKNI